MIEKSIDSLCTLVRGSSPRPSGDPRYYGGKVPRLMVKDVSRDGMYVTPKIGFLTEEGAAKSRAMKKGDLIIAVSGDPGEPSILKVDACIHDGFVGLRELKTDIVHTPYLYRYFKFYKLKSKSQAVGAIYKNLNTTQIKALRIPLPPLTEQKKITEILDAADALRQKDQQLIEHYDQLSQSLFLDMFGDPITNPKNWELKRIDQLCRIVRGSSPRPKGDPKYYGGSVPRLMVADLTRDGKFVIPQIDFLTNEGAKKSRFIKSGTVVMAVSGNVGLTSILSIDACIHDGFIAFKDLNLDVVNAYFLVDLMMFLKLTHASRQAGAIFKNITTTQIKEMKIPIPTMNLQNLFLEKIKNIEKGKMLAVTNFEKSSNLFNCLLQKAFIGELT